MPGPGFAVIDFETTGLFPGGHDRIVEVAVVHVSRDGAVTGRWDTLVNPERDLGAQHIHGIRAADVLDAPTFVQIMPGLVKLLDQRVIVAHNASFDTRFLLAELARANYVANVPIVSLCTMRLARELLPGAGRSLADCCSAFDIELDGAHRASVDAFATAQLLDAYIASAGNPEYWNHFIDDGMAHPWAAALPPAPIEAVWRARGSGIRADPASFLARITIKLPDVSGPAAHHDYLALLDRCLIDQALSVHEADALVGLAEELGIDRGTCAVLHVDYFEALGTVAWADGVLTADEISDLVAVAGLLDIPSDRLTRVLQRSDASGRHRAKAPDADAVELPDVPNTSAVDGPHFGGFHLEPGDQIVLTGDMDRARSDWEFSIVAAGFVPKAAVTKSVKLVVAADPDSLSGKARKARQYGIPIVDEATLVRMLGEIS
jgi:DNA polymerase-3 subunit epsilon